MTCRGRKHGEFPFAGAGWRHSAYIRLQVHRVAKLNSEYIESNVMNDGMREGVSVPMPVN